MNDLQAAYQHSLTTYVPNDDYQEIQDFLDKGYWVVVLESARYCGVTDARLPGADRYFLGAFKTESCAKRLLDSFKEDYDSDSNYSLLAPKIQPEPEPQPKPKPQPTQLIDDDDLPF